MNFDDSLSRHHHHHPTKNPLSCLLEPGNLSANHFKITMKFFVCHEFFGKWTWSDHMTNFPALVIFLACNGSNFWWFFCAHLCTEQFLSIQFTFFNNLFFLHRMYHTIYWINKFTNHVTTIAIFHWSKHAKFSHFQIIQIGIHFNQLLSSTSV